MYIDFENDSKLQELFNLALKLSDEDAGDVLSRLIRSYVEEVMRKQLIVTSTATKVSSTVPENSKALNKLPKIADRKHQINHKILRAFFLCEVDGLASRTKMAQVFLSENPDKPAFSFENNLNSMNTEAGNSHGKFFDVNGDVVSLAGEVDGMAKTYRHCFL